MTTLRRLAITTGGAGFPHAEQGHESGDLPFVKVSDFNHVGNERVITTCNNWVTRETAHRLRATVVPPGSILLPKVGAALLGNARRITSQASVFDNNILSVVPLNIISRYLHYWLSTVDAAQFAKPGPVPSMDNSAVLNLRVPIVSLHRQRAIADYLDTETGRIDALITKKRRMIDLLKGRRQTLITAAVTGAPAVLRPGDRMSGCRLKYVLDLNDSGTWGEDPTGDNDVVVLRSTDIRLNGSWRITDPAIRHISGIDKLRKRLAYGDIVVVKSSGSPEHLGKSAIVTEDVASMRPCFANFVQRLRPSVSSDSRYIWYVLNSKWAADEMARLGNTTTGLRNLNAEIIGSVWIPVTTLAKQRAIANYLDTESGRIDALITKKRRSIELLAERRESLITASVLGELAVPGVVV